jgi:hypothetical protein
MDLTIRAQKRGHGHRRFEHTYAAADVQAFELPDGSLYLRGRRGQRLWSRAGNEPFLGRAPRAARGEPFFPRKRFVRTGAGWRVLLDNPPLPFSRLAATDYVDTRELLVLFKCSLATLYRLIYQRGLRPARRSGRMMFFRKGDVVQWLNAHPWPGRGGGTPQWFRRAGARL